MKKYNPKPGDWGDAPSMPWPIAILFGLIPLYVFLWLKYM